MSKRYFVNFAANGDDDDRAMVAAEQIATSKSTIDSSKVDFAMPNRLLSSALTTVRFSFSQSVRTYIKISEFKILSFSSCCSFFFDQSRGGASLVSVFFQNVSLLTWIFYLCLMETG